MSASKRPNKQLKESDADIAPNQWTEATDHGDWILGKMEDAEEESDLVGGPAVSTNLDPGDLSDTGPLMRQHTPADMRPQHIHSRGLPDLA
jgi:hypothetical protein